jgi:hypothetical protein
MLMIVCSNLIERPSHRRKDQGDLRLHYPILEGCHPRIARWCHRNRFNGAAANQAFECGSKCGSKMVFVLSHCSARLSDVKKPACGRLLGDWLGLFLVSLASLQNVHPDLRPAVGLGQTLVCRVGRCLSRGAGRCANVGRRILSFAVDSQPEVRFRATAVEQIRDLYRLSGPHREQAHSYRGLCGP